MFTSSFLSLAYKGNNTFGLIRTQYLYSCMQLVSFCYSKQQIMLISYVTYPTQIHFTVPCCEQQECDPSASRGPETIVLFECKW